MGLLDVFDAFGLTGERSERYAPLLQETVTASTSGYPVATSWKCPVDGYVVALRPWHVPGSQNALKVKPVINKDGDTTPVDIPDYGDGERFITGEPGGQETYRMRKEIDAGEQIEIRANNGNASNAYRFRYVPEVVPREVL